MKTNFLVFGFAFPQSHPLSSRALGTDHHPVTLAPFDTIEKARGFAAVYPTLSPGVSYCWIKSPDGNPVK